MLNELIIHNLAVIERTEVCFAPGFNVLTGETGAGKSIIVDALGLLLGQRSRTDLIRTGQEHAGVEAAFNIRAQPQVQNWLRDNDLTNPDDEHLLLVKRVLSRQGRNKVYVNGSMASLTQLQELMQPLVAIYGQHEQQQLQRVENHLRLLDAFGGCGSVAGDYRTVFRHWQQLQRTLQQLRAASAERRDRMDMLLFQSHELREAGVKAGEYVELEQEHLLLRHGERLSSITRKGYTTLYAANGAICEQLGTLKGDLEGILKIDPRLGSALTAVSDAMYGLEDAALQLRDHADTVVFDSQRQHEVEQRLAMLQGLRRKYAADEAGLILKLEQMDAELERLDNSAAQIQGLEQELEQSKQVLEQAGTRLSEVRAAAAKQLQDALHLELKGLAMAHARFEVRFTPRAQPGVDGMEEAEFHFSANPGQELRPLAATASGGELSRVMLALRKAAPGSDTLGTVVFDEVDAGIGGEAATAVGQRLRDVAARSQVLCVTHLPQVAAFATTQFRIEKVVEDEQTSTRVQRLEGEQRAGELARMLGGTYSGQQSIEHARALLQHSAKYTAQLGG
ncbi:MAG: DNA repair protein RecN [Desulfuromonadaceae bacterium]|nr:DNA repair protein RecN [Desulfuromonas sp.]MDY0185649.1 DNA repair protein RecN [Desulfuromonadaceae bacterium]